MPSVGIPGRPAAGTSRRGSDSGATSPEEGMNKLSIAALLLPLLASTVSAQQLAVTSAHSPRGYQISVRSETPDAVVFLVLGMDIASIRLPGGQILGVSPDILLVQFADSTGSTTFQDIPTELTDRAAILQAAAVHPRLPIDGPGGITLSRVQRL